MLTRNGVPVVVLRSYLSTAGIKLQLAKNQDVFPQSLSFSVLKMDEVKMTMLKFDPGSPVPKVRWPTTRPPSRLWANKV